MALYWQLIAMCWLALAARLACAALAARLACAAGAALAAVMVAPTTNKLPGIATSRTSFISTLRVSWSPAGHVPSTSMCRAPGRERNTAKDPHARARRGRGPGFWRSRACLRPGQAGHTYDQGLAGRLRLCLARSGHGSRRIVRILRAAASPRLLSGPDMAMLRSGAARLQDPRGRRTVLQSFCDGRLFAQRTSLAPAEVVGLHGWARSREDLAGPLAGLNALALDLPGFGASPEPPAAWDSRAYAALVAEVLAGLDRPQVLLGHSFGGRVAVKLAAWWPELVTGLVLAGVPLLRQQPGGGSPAWSFRVARWGSRHGLVSEGRMEKLRQRTGSED